VYFSSGAEFGGGVYFFAPPWKLRFIWHCSWAKVTAAQEVVAAQNVMHCVIEAAWIARRVLTSADV
jgi:hypothetical protein